MPNAAVRRPNNYGHSHSPISLTGVPPIMGNITAIEDVDYLVSDTEVGIGCPTTIVKE